MQCSANQVSYLTQKPIWESDEKLNAQESQEVSPFQVFTRLQGTDKTA